LRVNYTIYEKRKAKRFCGVDLNPCVSAGGRDGKKIKNQNVKVKIVEPNHADTPQAYKRRASRRQKRK
jgi:hypothetical protein